MTAEEASESKHFFLQKTANSVIQLKRNHNYYYQLQGQLFVSGFEHIDFIVYFGRGKPLFVERIFFDSNLVHTNMIPRLEYFYKRAFLPELLTERVKRKKTLYIHGGWISFKDWAKRR